MGDTPIHTAIRVGSQKILEVGKDTPIHTASRIGSQKILEAGKVQHAGRSVQREAIIRHCFEWFVNFALNFERNKCSRPLPIKVENRASKNRIKYLKKC